jgi:hypothetical protein
METSTTVSPIADLDPFLVGVTAVNVYKQGVINLQTGSETSFISMEARFG